MDDDDADAIDANDEDAEGMSLLAPALLVVVVVVALEAPLAKPPLSEAVRGAAAALPWLPPLAAPMLVAFDLRRSAAAVSAAANTTGQ